MDDTKQFTRQSYIRALTNYEGESLPTICPSSVIIMQRSSFAEIKIMMDRLMSGQTFLLEEKGNNLEIVEP